MQTARMSLATQRQDAGAGFHDRLLGNTQTVPLLSALALQTAITLAPQ